MSTPDGTCFCFKSLMTYRVTMELHEKQFECLVAFNRGKNSTAVIFHKTQSLSVVDPHTDDANVSLVINDVFILYQLFRKISYIGMYVSSRSYYSILGVSLSSSLTQSRSLNSYLILRADH